MHRYQNPSFAGTFCPEQYTPHLHRSSDLFQHTANPVPEMRDGWKSVASFEVRHKVYSPSAENR